MNFHLLPLLDNHLDIVKSKIASIWEHWLEDWISVGICENPPEIKMELIADENLSSLFGMSYINWYQAQSDEGQLSIGVGYEPEFISCLIQQMTGCQSCEFDDANIDVVAMVERVVDDLTSQISGENLLKVTDNTILLNCIREISTLNNNMSGWLVKVSSEQKTITLLLPNNIVKHLIFGEDKKGRDHLVTRESAIANCQVLLSAKIEGLKISLQDFSTLQIGDVLTTRQKTTEQLRVYVEDCSLKNTVVLGKQDEQKAIQFT